MHPYPTESPQCWMTPTPNMLCQNGPFQDRPNHIFPNRFNTMYLAPNDYQRIKIWAPRVRDGDAEGQIDDPTDLRCRRRDHIFSMMTSELVQGYFTWYITRNTNQTAVRKIFVQIQPDLLACTILSRRRFVTFWLCILSLFITSL